MTVRELRKVCMIDELCVNTEHGWVSIKPKNQIDLRAYNECEVTDIEAYASASNPTDGVISVSGRIRVIATR